MVRNFTSVDGSKITVGENAAENEELCKSAKQRDLWFHLDGHPSPHAILHVEGKGQPSRDSIHDAQQLVKYFSRMKDVAQVAVIHIEAKWVSGGKESKSGSVSLKKQPTRAVVVYNEETVNRLLRTRT